MQDLNQLSSMGFRGEALSSIAAVAQVELVTRTQDDLAGTRYEIEGAVEKAFEQVGAPQGTTILVRNLFYNIPVRRKFLKQPATEAGYVAEMMEYLAMSRPDISFKYVQNGQVKFYTSGNGELKEVIYRIYGREITNHLLPIDVTDGDIQIRGFLGKPEINRSNRNFEHYFLNARYLKSKVLSKAIEDGYKQYVMQHKFPFVVLHFSMPAQTVDVNVHPSKMEVRFLQEQTVYQTTVKAITNVLRSRELIVDHAFGKEEAEQKSTPADRVPVKTPEPFLRSVSAAPTENNSKQPDREEFPAFAVNFDLPDSTEEKANPIVSVRTDFVAEPSITEVYGKKQSENLAVSAKDTPELIIENAEQSTLFAPEFLSEKSRESYEIIGQVFKTYWIIAYSDRLYMIDQHAAHEKVKYERLVKAMREKNVMTQGLMPPQVVHVDAKEERVLSQHLDAFAALGFELEEFGEHSYVIRGVPVDLYGCSYQELFSEVLDELAQGPVQGNFEVVKDKLASMACKSAVKGNMSMSRPELEALIDELLSLDNPYFCPHGRPVIISMTKQEIEKKFKRIV